MKKLCCILACCMLAACSAKEPEKQEEPQPEKQIQKVSFIGVGDNLIHEMIYVQADGANGEMGDGLYDFSSMYAPVKDQIAQADLAYIDQESIVGGDELGISGYPTFNSPAQVAKDVAAVGFDLVNTANNHCLDKYQAGIDASSALWNDLGLVMAGTYTSQEDRDTIRTIERNGIKFSFLAYTYGTNGIEPPNSYSVAYFDEEAIRKDVAAAKEVSDVVIVSAHWGEENINEPTEFQTHYAQLFADLGVDVVIGEHPHVIQPVEWVQGISGNQTLVVYSLGNFLSGMLDVNNVLSGMIKFDFVKENDQISIQNVKWDPLITHYRGDADDILNTRRDFAVYRLADYTEELARQHGLNGYDGQNVSIPQLYEKTKEIIQKIEVIEK